MSSETSASAAPAPAAPPFVPMPVALAALYAAASVLLGITQGLGINLVSANLTGIQGSIGATQAESNWLLAAYFATNLGANMMLFKIRSQFGLRRFAEIGIIAYVVIVGAHLFISDLTSALVVRALLGIASAPLGTLAFYYMLEWLPPAKKMSVGVSFGMLGSALAPMLARVVGPIFLDVGDGHSLYFLEVGLALMCLAAIFVLPLTHPPRFKAFDKVDIISFPLIAAAFAALSVFLSLGRYYWWFETPWLGLILVAGLALFALFVAIELNRERPMIDLRWIASKEMLSFAGILLIFRVLLTQQTSGTFAMFTTLGLQPDQLIGISAVVVGASFIGTVIISQVVAPQRAPLVFMIASLLVAVAALLDSSATATSRPEQFFVSQALMGMASALFMPAAMIKGFGSALKRGRENILSFLVVFQGVQLLGGMLGSALMSSFVLIREQFHSNEIAGSLTLLNPMVAQRVQSYGAAYSRVLGDQSLRNAEGVVLLGKAATQQAYVLAYNDLSMFIAALGFVGALLFFFQLIRPRLRALLTPQPQAA